MSIRTTYGAGVDGDQPMESENCKQCVACSPLIPGVW